MPFELPCSSDLKWRVSLQSKTKVPSSTGTVIETYNTILTTRARVTQPFGSRFLGTVQTEDRITHSFTIRATTAAKNALYILFDNTRFRVKALLRHGQRLEWMELLAEEMGTVG